MNGETYRTRVLVNGEYIDVCECNCARLREREQDDVARFQHPVEVMQFIESQKNRAFVLFVEGYKDQFPIAIERVLDVDVRHEPTETNIVIRVVGIKEGNRKEEMDVCFRWTAGTWEEEGERDLWIQTI